MVRTEKGPLPLENCHIILIIVENMQLHIVSDVEIDRSRVSPALTIFGFVNYELNNVKFSAHLLYCIVSLLNFQKISSLALKKVYKCKIFTIYTAGM